MIKFIKYFIGLTSLIIGCMGIINGDNDFIKISNLKYNDNNYNKIEIEYIATLIIPKISFSRVLYNIESIKNNLEDNIIFVDGSSMPNEDNGNVIIAGHNGNSEISYFKNIHKLDIDDILKIKYKDIEYTYKIVKKYLVQKDGTVEINRDIRYSTATLITCYGKDKQLVIIANLEQKK